MKISVVTPSVRPGGLDIVKKCLEAQDFPREEFEWLVCSPFEYSGADKWIKERKKKAGDFYNLNKSFNDLFRVARGDLIISITDMTWFPPDTLSNFWLHHEANPVACVSGIGHKYSDVDESGMPINMFWRDPRLREDYGSFWEINPIDLELMLTSIPTQGIYAVGGVQEEMDRYAALSEKMLAIRLDKLGYKFFIDSSLEYRSLPHGRVHGTKAWDKKYFEGCKYYDKWLAGLQNGTEPVNVG